MTSSNPTLKQQNGFLFVVVNNQGDIVNRYGSPYSLDLLDIKRLQALACASHETAQRVAEKLTKRTGTHFRATKLNYHVQIDFD